LARHGMTLWRGLFDYATDTDALPITRQECNACPDERVAEGYNNSIPRLGSPF
jgi:hypothetical protein